MIRLLHVRPGLLAVAAIALVLGFGSNAAPTAQAQGNPVDGAPETTITGMMANFVPNKGQFGNPDETGILYMTRAGDLTAWFMPDRVMMQTSEREIEQPSADGSEIFYPEGASHAVGMQFVDPSSEVRVLGAKKLPGYVSYFVGEGESWARQLPIFQDIKYQNLWPGVDMRVENQFGKVSARPVANDADRILVPFLKTTFELQPGVDPSVVRYSYDAGDGYDVTLTPDGRIEVTTSLGSLYELEPHAFAISTDNEGRVTGKRRAVDVAYRLQDGVISFDVGPVAAYEILVIDPVSEWATIATGTSNDYLASIRTDASGLYVSGMTYAGTGWPVTPGQLPYNALADFAVMKLDAGGSILQYVTFVGGGYYDYQTGMEVHNGEPVMFGQSGNSTSYANFPGVGGNPVVPASPQSYRGTASTSLQYNCAFVRLNSTGTAIIASTAFSANDTVYPATSTANCYVNDIELAADGTWYWVGGTEGSQTGPDGWPAGGWISDNPNPAGTIDAASAGRLSSDWSQLLNFSYVTQPYYSGLMAVELIGTDVVMVGSQGQSTSYPPIFSYTANIGSGLSTSSGYDWYVARMNSALTSPTYITRIGGAGTDYVCGATYTGTSGSYSGTNGSDCLNVRPNGQCT